MASVTEIFHSRDGGVRGQHGSEGVHRLFHVITDAQGDDPYSVIQSTSGGVRLGSTHPWNAFGIVVIGFSQLRLAPLLWEVEALYGVPLVIDPTRPWDVSIDTALETYTEYVDLDGQPIGPAIYHPAPDPTLFTAQGLIDENNMLSNQRNFDVNGPKFYAATTKNGRQELYITKDRKRRATGITRTRDVATMRLSRTLANLRPDYLASVMSMVNTTNSSTFFGAGKDQAKFVGLSSRSTTGVLPGQSLPNVVWDVSLSFAIDWSGHNPSNEYDIYQHEDGTEAIVEDAQRKKVVRQYRLYEKTEFNTILSLLDS